MAKQKGIIKLKGSLGGLTFYERNRKELVRTTGGPTKERIENDPKFHISRNSTKAQALFLVSQIGTPDFK